MRRCPMQISCAMLNGLFKENAVLKQAREILKTMRSLVAIGSRTMVECLLCQSNCMSFAFIDRMKKAFPIELSCRVLKVTSRGLRAWRAQPMSQRQRKDMVLLVPISANNTACLLAVMADFE